MAQQVSGNDKTLIQAIRDGDVERPGLLNWNQFQVWRRQNGMRPVVARDGYTTTTTQESALWRAVMNEFHGDGWLMLIAQGGEEPRELTTEPQHGVGLHEEVREELMQPREPRPEPAAGAELPQPRGAPSLLGPEPAAPASTEVEATPRPAVFESPSSGGRSSQRSSQIAAAAEAAGISPLSPVPSFDSKNPGTPVRLKAKVLKPFVPQKEHLQSYQERVTKQAAFLQRLGEPLGEGILEVMLQRASYLEDIFNEARDDMRRQIRVLRLSLIHI